MKAIKFHLRGTFAFFKKPDVNKQVYFTFDHIHKVALLGILGSILGKGGYRDRCEDNVLPPFYEELKDLKVSIVPIVQQGYFSKKIQYFTNTTKLASKVSKKPSTLEVKEQWIEKPCWDIYITNENHPDFHILFDMLVNRKAIYIPYLGKNDHPAIIENVKMIDVTPCEEEYITMHSLFQENFVEVEHVANVEIDERPYFFSNPLPIVLHPETGLYELEKLTHTNLPVSVTNPSKIWMDDEKGLYFI